MVPIAEEGEVGTGSAPRYSVSEVARMVGVSPSTLRNWERSGLVASSRTAAGWRSYDPGEVTAAREVRRLRETEGLAVHAIRRRVGSSRRSRPSPASVAEPQHSGGLGGRLRAARLEADLTLRSLAAAAGVSPSLVSAVERGTVQPSVASLHKLSAGLGTTIAALLSGSSPACTSLAGDSVALEMPVPGVRIEDLSGSAQVLEPQRFTIDPGRGSGGAYQHSGEEFLYVLEGTLSISLDGEAHVDVGAGLSLCFASTRSHRWWNPGKAVTRVLWINTPRSF